MGRAYFSMTLEIEGHLRFKWSNDLPEAGNRDEHLFIVRIWQEAGRRLSQEWRGSVEHIPTRQRFYFASFSDLTDFIARRLKSKPHDEKNSRGEVHDG